MCGCLSCAPYWGPGLQPRHVPRLGFDPKILDLQAGSQSTEPHQPGIKLTLTDSFGSSEAMCIWTELLFGSCCSKCELWTSITSIIWELADMQISGLHPTYPDLLNQLAF